MHGSMVGQWVCLEEYADIDLLALNAWQKADVIGYEVKVSRGDMRAELLHPHKRLAAVTMCTEFYFAVPKGLLRPDELAWEEPAWDHGAFERQPCPGVPPFGETVYGRRRPHPRHVTGRYGGACRGRYRRGKTVGPYTLTLPVPLAVVEDVPEYVVHDWLRVDGVSKKILLEGDAYTDAVTDWVRERTQRAEDGVVCPTCGGKGYVAKSRVEDEAPTLWVPADVGLIEVGGNGCTVVRKSPRRPNALGLLHHSYPADARNLRAARQHANQVARWASNRPDPRHVRVRSSNGNGNGSMSEYAGQMS